MSKTLRPVIAAVLVLCTATLIGFTVSGCASAPQLPYHGFSDQTSLDQKDAYVKRESIGGSLDPMNLGEENQRYEHHSIAYNRIEEGYYQWGMKLYSLGYRDVYYVRDLAPHAFKHELLDVYDHAIEQGFEDAEDAAKK